MSKRFAVHILLSALISVLLPCMACLEVCAATGNIDSTDKYAWSENAGWINFGHDNQGVTVYSDHLEDFAWSESLGWINLGSHESGGAYTYGNTNANDWGVNSDEAGNLSGYAWCEAAGWINFIGVTIDPVTGIFDGYAWSESLGWIHFQNTDPDYALYKVRKIVPEPDPPLPPVTIPNIPPVITGQYPMSTLQATSFSIGLESLVVTDPDNSYPYGFTLFVSTGANYTFSGNIVTPDEDFTGTLSVPVMVNDGQDTSGIYTLEITVRDVNTSPVIIGQLALTTDNKTPLAISLSDLIVTDPDNVYPAEFSLTIKSCADCTISDYIITPDPDFVGTLTLQVVVNDGKNDSGTFDLDISVTGENNPPEFTSEPVLEATEDEPYTYSVLAFDPDRGDTLTISANLPGWLALTDHGNGTALISGTPENDDTGSYDLSLEVTDSKGEKDSQSFTVYVTPVNDAPVIIAQNTLTTLEETPLSISFDDLVVEDPDNIFPQDFTLTLFAGKNYSFSDQTITPSPEFIGILLVPVRVNDGQADSETFDLSITVTENKNKRKISGTVTDLESNREIFINSVSRSLNAYRIVKITGTGEKVLPYLIENLDPASDYQVEISSSYYPYQAFNGKESWEEADEVDISEADAVGVDFILPPAEGIISGRVIFPSGANAGEKVTILASSESTGFQKSVEISQESGEESYTISGLFHAEDYMVSAWSDNYVKQHYPNTKDTESATPVNTRTEEAKAIDFTLESGAFISGTVSGNEPDGIRVEAWSDSTNSGNSVMVSADGSYKIEGLEQADDFKVSAAYPQGSPFYYGKEQSVSDKTLASPVSTMNESPDYIDLILPEIEGISGTITDQDTLPVVGIWVEARVDSNQAESGQVESGPTGNGTYSEEDGTYIIKALPNNLLYRVKAMPDPETSYVSQEISGISTGSEQVDFILEKISVFTIYGQIIDIHGEPIPNVRVEISSNSLNVFATSGADMSGRQDLHIPNSYSIEGLPPGNDYSITAYPPANSSYAVLTRTGISINSDTDFNIVLTASSLSAISGRVSDYNGVPVKGAEVSVVSSTKNFSVNTITGANGNYEITNTPNASDYKIIVTASGYMPQERFGMSPLSGIDFTLYRSKVIFGSVKDQNSGKGMAGVRVEIFSKSMGLEQNYNGTCLTDQNGNYRINGLNHTDDTGSLIDDYRMTVYAENYAPKSAYGHQAGDEVNVVLSEEERGSISGTVAGMTSYMSAEAGVNLDIFEEYGDFIKNVPVDENGYFSDTTLFPDMRVQLKFILVDLDGNTIWSEWAGANDIGILASDNEQATPSHAKVYDTGAVVSFSFSENIDRIMNNIISSRRSNIGNLDENTLSLKRKNSQFETRVLNLRPIPQKEIFTDVAVTMTWESSQTGEEENYYYLFNREQAFEINKRNAPRGRPVQVRTATSQRLTGNDEIYYCHVAQVDGRGRIRQTTSREFRVDSMPPMFGNITVPAITTDILIPLITGASGAIRMYVSNTSYGEGGQWEDWIKEKTWRLLDGDGLKKIYVMFKDRSGNTSKAFAVTEKKSSIIPDAGGDGLHTITIIVGPNGTVSPLNKNIKIETGSNLTVTILPNIGYETDKVRINGRKVWLDNHFYFINIQKDHTMDVTFKPIGAD